MAFQYETVNSADMSTHYNARSLRYFDTIKTLYTKGLVCIPALSSSYTFMLLNSKDGYIMQMYQENTHMEIRRIRIWKEN